MSDDRDEKPTGGGNGRRPRPAGGMRFGRGVFAWVLFIALAIMLYLYVQNKGQFYTEVGINVFWDKVDSGDLNKATIQNNEVLGEFKTPFTPVDGKPQFKHFRVTFPLGTTSEGEFQRRVMYDASGQKRLTELNADNSDNLLMSLLIPFIPWLLVFAVIWFIFIRQLRNNGGAGGMLGNFGRSKHKITSKEHTNVTFDDVAGVEEAKDEVREIVEFLKNPKKFQRLGGRIPRGVLLVGEPGTGKTMLAKAIAGEADAPFFSISGSDFVEMFVGVGASRVRDLFKQAKDNSPCIIFLDEIDAVGRRRGSGFSSGGHDEREQTLNAILVEMDGFDSNDQVIVCAATNRVDVLDPALTRPGRFDRQVYVPLPDVKGRLEILKVHSRKVKLGPVVDMSRLARATPGFSGADLAAIINEAALAATLKDKDFIEQDDLEEARDKVRWGRAKKSRVIDEKDKLATAYHEAGHAVVQCLNPDADPIHKVTILPRGNYGGATMSLPEKDRSNYGKKWCFATLRTLFAGRIAEEMFCGDVNTGALGDIRMASNLARQMTREWGMNDRVGFVYYGEDEQKQNFMGTAPDYSQETAKLIDEEVKKLIDSLYEETRGVIEQNRERVDAMAKALLKYETLDANEVDMIMNGQQLTRPTVSDMIAPPPSTPRPPVTPPNPESNPGLGLGGGPVPHPG
ncbi:MAG: ATP-dependent zinc metalloprotease FtsH [Burkholderiales bacterium]|nr:ATP-dependent zinc metalloprotease FtsH [Phycisphaerae bacterium]